MFDVPATELSSTAASSQTARAGGLPRGYVAAWAGLTCLAGLYIAQVALQTASITTMMGSAAVAPPQQAEPSLQAELATLRHSLAEYQRNVGRLRSDLETRLPDAGTVASLSALEERMSMTTGLAVSKAPPPSIPAPPSPQEPHVPAIASAPHVPIVTSAAALEAWTGKAPASATVPRPLTLEKLAPPIETGSIAATSPAITVQPGKMSGQLPKANPPQQTAAIQAPSVIAVAPPTIPTPMNASTPAATAIAFGPPVVKTEPKPFAVQLASGTSIDEIRYSWSILSEQNVDSLGKLQPRYTATTSETAGPTFDLLAGPVKTAADAKRICKSLASRGIDCKVASYSGEAF